jgi:hypothetical protein
MIFSEWTAETPRSAGKKEALKLRHKGHEGHEGHDGTSQSNHGDAERSNLTAEIR